MSPYQKKAPECHQTMRKKWECVNSTAKFHQRSYKVLHTSDLLDKAALYLLDKERDNGLKKSKGDCDH